VEKTRAALFGRADADALDPYLTLGELRRELAGGKEWPALDAALNTLEASGEIRRTDHGYVSAEAAAASAGEAPEIAGKLLELFGASGEAAAAETPTVAVVAEIAGLPLKEAQRFVDALVRQGRLTKVGEDLYYPPARLQALMGRLMSTMEQQGQLTLAQARDLLGTSRRYAQALLEHMDSEGLTLRVGEARRLRRRRR
jgi:selenocysteine-specific elongation factor